MTSQFLSDTSNFEETLSFLQKEFSALQTGRATTKLVEDISIEAWGARQPLKHIARISVPDAQSILVDPFDRNILADIERSFQKQSDLGLSIKNDGVSIRLQVPILTEERRKEIVKIVHKLAENARIAIRNKRKKFHDEIKHEKAEGNMSEDEFFRNEKKLQEVVDEYTKKIDELSSHKEKEVMTI